MNDDATTILADLEAVARLRAERDADPSLARRVALVKDYQARRFRLTYADLLASTRYERAANFFLDELYGPHDFCERDAQFARVVPAMTRMLPDKLLGTVIDLARLHASTEAMDTAMARHMAGESLDATGYVAAWRACGNTQVRQSQIDLTLAIGRTLDKTSGHRMVRQTLRLMRSPAQMAGLGEIQRFLEAGLAAFEAMKGAQDFLDIIREREAALMGALFSTAPPAAHRADVPQARQRASPPELSTLLP